MIKFYIVFSVNFSELNKIFFTWSKLNDFYFYRKNTNEANVGFVFNGKIKKYKFDEKKLKKNLFFLNYRSRAIRKSLVIEFLVFFSNDFQSCFKKMTHYSSDILMKAE